MDIVQDDNFDAVSQFCLSSNEKSNKCYYTLKTASWDILFSLVCRFVSHLIMEQKNLLARNCRKPRMTVSLIWIITHLCVALIIRKGIIGGHLCILEIRKYFSFNVQRFVPNYSLQPLQSLHNLPLVRKSSESDIFHNEGKREMIIKIQQRASVRQLEWCLRASC